MSHARCVFGALAAFAAISLPLSALAQATARLRAYNVDPATVSVSGLSSGANMAIQLGVAYSSRIAGVGVFSGVPYDCLRAGNVTATDCTGAKTPDIEPLAANIRAWSGSAIDDVANLARQRVYLFVGQHDGMFSGTVVGQTASLLRRFVDAANLRLETSVDAGHLFPADFDNPYSAGGWRCSSLTVPIANCDFDGAGAMLQWIYGPLSPRNNALPATGYSRIDQSEFVSRPQGMDDTALLYVPASCEAGAACRLHVFLHSCGQSYFTRGDEVIPRYTGHTRWAETNNIIVLFPQAYPDQYINTQGCWDDAGVFGAQYDQKGGAQIEAIMAMVARITSGYAGTTRSVEYYHAGFNHYFVTSEADEIAALDGGKFAGWARTGETIAVYPAGTPGTKDVCRFFSGGYYAPASSHFYTADATECASLMSSDVWQFEGNRFAVKLPDAQGRCGAGETALFRLYNQSQGGVPNHRYTTSPAIRASMVAAGWVPEGSGELGVIGCVRQ